MSADSQVEHPLSFGGLAPDALQLSDLFRNPWLSVPVHLSYCLVLLPGLCRSSASSCCFYRATGWPNGYRNDPSAGWTPVLASTSEASLSKTLSPHLGPLLCSWPWVMTSLWRRTTDKRIFLQGSTKYHTNYFSSSTSRARVSTTGPN